MRFLSRRAAFASLILLAAGTLAGFLWVARVEIETRWICYRLSNCTEAERKPYLDAIVKECRVGAIPALLQILGRSGASVELDAIPGSRFKIRFERPTDDVLPALFSIIGCDCDSARRLLLSQLEDASWVVRNYALEGLAEVGAPGGESVKILGRRLEDPEPVVCVHAVAALERCGASGVPYLAKAVEHADKQVRLRAIDALGELGPVARAASGELEHAAADPDGFLAGDARAALRYLSGETPEAPLMTFSNFDGPSDDPVGTVSRMMAESLEREDRDSRCADVAVLCTLGQPAIPSLSKPLSHPDPAVRRSAIDALARIGLKTSEAIEMAQRAVQDADCIVSCRAREALEAVGR